MASDKAPGLDSGNQEIPDVSGQVGCRHASSEEVCFAPLRELARPARSRPCCAPSRCAHRDRDAGTFRDRRQGPDERRHRHVRRFRVVRDASPGRFRRAHARAPAGPDRAGDRRGRLHLPGNARFALGLAFRRRHGGRRFRGALRRRGELRAGERLDGAAALAHPAGHREGTGLGDSRPARRVGARLGGRPDRHRGAVAGPDALSAACPGRGRLPSARRPAARPDRVPAEAAGRPLASRAG